MGTSMKTLYTRMIGLVLLAVAYTSSAQWQRPGVQPAHAAPAPTAQVETNADLVREIDDPHTGERWLLVRNPDHPGGPGRLILASDMNAIQLDKTSVAGWAPTPRGSSSAERPVIHAGDKLIVEEHTAIADARLQGIALSSAFGGASLKVRLSIGGKVVRAVATGSGRAALLPEAEARR